MKKPLMGIPVDRDRSFRLIVTGILTGILADLNGYTFAYSTARETTADWLGATAPALRFYGGCTEFIVPDNHKAIIANADRYEPRVNDTVLDFARHYGCSVLSARPRHPQDKAKAELAVQVVERWILMRLRHHKFETVDEVNQAIEPLLVQLNNKPFQKLMGIGIKASKHKRNKLKFKGTHNDDEHNIGTIAQPQTRRHGRRLAGAAQPGGYDGP